MAALEVPVEFIESGVEVSARKLAREIQQLSGLTFQQSLVFVANEVRNRMQSQASLWPKPPTPPFIRRQRTGLSQAAMSVHVRGNTVVVVNNVFYARFVNYSRLMGTTGIPNWNYRAVERTLARDWLAVRNRAHRKARQRARVLNVYRPVNRGLASSLFLPIIVWNEEEEEEERRRRALL